MKIIADENIPLVHQYFGGLGEVVLLPGRSITARDLESADVLVVRSVTRVDQSLLEGSPVRYVGTCTIGTDHLDTVWLEKNNIAWANAPGCNANSVVEYVFSALSALGVSWKDKIIGVIGCGNVGGLLYKRLQDLGVKCSVYDPFLSKENIPDLATLEDVLTADIVCCHAPLTQDGNYPTYHMLGAKELAQLKLGAVLLSAGRGAVIDNQALNQLLERRSDLRVVLDVWENEPEPFLPLLQKVDIATPHIAGYSYDGKVKGTEMIFSSLCSFLQKSASQGANFQKPIDLPEFAQQSEYQYLKGPLSTAEAINSAYRILDDDKNMRANLMGLQGLALKQAFDALRKNYPKRREFSHYLLDSITPEQRVLGFSSSN